MTALIIKRQSLRGAKVQKRGRKTEGRGEIEERTEKMAVRNQSRAEILLAREKRKAMLRKRRKTWAPFYPADFLSLRKRRRRHYSQRRNGRSTNEQEVAVLMVF